MDFETIDWNRMWAQALRRTTSAFTSPAQWAGAAGIHRHWLGPDDYLDQLLARINPAEGWTVLDVGAGAGAFSLPAAARFERVTALDLSSGALSVLAERARQAGLENIRPVHLAWEEAVIGRDLQPHDVVVASRSFTMEDARGALAKMDRAARRSVHLTWRACPRPLDRLISEILGRPYYEYPSYIYLYNLLYQMGIQAGVEFLSHPLHVRYPDLETALTHWRLKMGGLSPKEEETLSASLPGILKPDPRGGWSAEPIPMRWALLWWSKEPARG